MVTTATDELLEVGDVSKMFRVSPSTIRLWELQGRLPRARRLASGRRVWLAEAFSGEIGDGLIGPSHTDQAVDLATV